MRYEVVCPLQLGHSFLVAFASIVIHTHALFRGEPSVSNTIQRSADQTTTEILRESARERARAPSPHTHNLFNFYGSEGEPERR